MSKKRVSGLAFEFSCFSSETPPLRISTGKKKETEKYQRLFFLAQRWESDKKKDEKRKEK